MRKTTKFLKKVLLTLAVGTVHLFLMFLPGLMDSKLDFRPAIISVVIVSIDSAEETSIIPNVTEQKSSKTISKTPVPNSEARLSQSPQNKDIEIQDVQLKVFVESNFKVKDGDAVITNESSVHTPVHMQTNRWQLEASHVSSDDILTDYAENNAPSSYDLCFDFNEADCKKRDEMILEGYKTYFENGRIFSRRTLTGEKSEYDNLSPKAAESLLKRKVDRL